MLTQKPLLLAIGQVLRAEYAEYSVFEEPVPEHFAKLLKELEGPPSGRSA
jgi:Anti-sigma factor NepR